MSLTKVTHSMILGDVAYLIDFGGGAGKTASENNLAFTKAFAASNTIVLPPGTITYSVTIVLDGNKNLIGVGEGTTILEYTGTSHAVSVSNYSNNMSDVQIKANVSALSGVYLNNAYSNHFFNVEVTNNPAKGWWLYGDDVTRSVYWNVFDSCGCNTAVAPVVLSATGTGAVNANAWYDGIWRTSAASGGIVCYLDGGGYGCGGNTWVNGDWTGYGGTAFEVSNPLGTGVCTQNCWFGIFIDTGGVNGFVLNAGASTNTILGGVAQATNPVVQNNSPDAITNTDIIMVSSLRYLQNIRQSAWLSPTLLNGWSDYGGAYCTAQYYRDPNRTIHIKGTVAGGTTTSGTNIFVLPAGYRPLQNHVFAQTSYSGATPGSASITVAQNGAVFVTYASGNTLLSIDCMFRAEQ